MLRNQKKLILRSFKIIYISGQDDAPIITWKYFKKKRLTDALQIPLPKLQT